MLGSVERRIVDGRALGGAGSGNFGHVGRPGEVGGSASTGVKVVFVPGDADILLRNEAAGVYSAKDDTVYINEKYKGNEHLLNHEVGHALMHGVVQPSHWAEPLRADPEAWGEFTQTSVGKTYINYRGGSSDDPYSIDWVEAEADLYMAWKAGKLEDAPRVIDLIKSNLEYAKTVKASRTLTSLSFPLPPARAARLLAAALLRVQGSATSGNWGHQGGVGGRGNPGGSTKKTSTISAKELFDTGGMVHGSSHELTELQPGSMFSDDPVWAAGYTTKFIGGGEREEVTGRIHQIKVPDGPTISVRTVHQAEEKLIDMARRFAGREPKTLREAADIVAKETDLVAILAKDGSRITGGILIHKASVTSTTNPTEALHEAKKRGLSIPSNLKDLGSASSGNWGHQGGVGGPGNPGGSTSRKAFVEAAIKRGDAHQVTEDEFLEYHVTGHIQSDAYERYEAGDLDFIQKKEFATLLDTREVNGQTVEIRVQAEPATYSKRTVAAPDAERDRLYAEYEEAAKKLGTTPMSAGIDLGHDSDAYNSLREFEQRWINSGSDFVRDERGLVVNLTPEEMRAQGLPAVTYTVGAFVGDKAVGYAGDEFGASGVYVTRAYQRHGIGLTLLKTYLDKSGRLATGRQLGQMTPAGQELVRKLHRQLVKEAAARERALGSASSGNWGHQGGVGGPGNPGGSTKRGVTIAYAESVTVEHDTGSVTFKTGEPVTFPYFRQGSGFSDSKSSLFGQDIEPHGPYLSFFEKGSTPRSTQEQGIVTFHAPLVLSGEGGYNAGRAGEIGPLGWKARLSSAYGGKKGLALSRAVRNDGYDGIVTIITGTAYPYVGEIVDLRNLRGLGGPGSGNFGHVGRPGQIGGSGKGISSTGTSSGTVSPSGVASFEEYGTALREMDRRIRIVKDRATMIAEQMGVDPSIIQVVHKEPHGFTVGNQEFSEAGHYDPKTGQIEINAQNSYDDRMSVTQGIVAHEVFHAQFDAVTKAQEREHAAIVALSVSERKRLFEEPEPNLRGNPKPEAMSELKERFPASAAFAETWGDTYLGTPPAPKDTSWPPEAIYSDMRDHMVNEDGHSAYAKAYWLPGVMVGSPGVDRRAVNETLAEVTRAQVVPDSWSGMDNKPAANSPWVKLAQAIRDAYPKVVGKQRLKAAGGPGSGNFGHQGGEGGPNNPGGSTKSIATQVAEAESIIAEAKAEGRSVLFHSGDASIDNDLAEGIRPTFGPWLEDVLSGATDEEETAQQIRESDPVSFFSTEPSWVAMKTAHVLDKHVTDVTVEDIRQHGQLSIIGIAAREPDDRNMSESESEAAWAQYDASSGKGNDPDDFMVRGGQYGEDIFYFGTTGEGRSGRPSSEVPFGVEPKDIFSQTEIIPDMTLTGDVLVEFLEKNYPQHLPKGFRGAGGPGSGNFGHAGRPGQVGGSSALSGSVSPLPPSLSTLPHGSGITTHTGFSEESVAAIHHDALSTISPAVMNLLDEANVKIHLTDEGVSGTPVLAHLKNVRPRGWPVEYTWDGVAGAYDESSKTVVVGRGLGESKGSILAHEIGHGIHHALDITGSSITHLIPVWEKSSTSFSPYFRQTQKDTLGPAGFNETFAESYSIFAHHGLIRVSETFGSEWAVGFGEVMDAIEALGPIRRVKGES